MPGVSGRLLYPYWPWKPLSRDQGGSRKRPEGGKVCTQTQGTTLGRGVLLAWGK